MKKHQRPDPTVLLASLLSMMTRFSCLGCPRLAGRIRRNLALLHHYPDKDMPPQLKELAQRLEHEWAQLHLAISDISDSPVAGEKRTDSSIVNEHPITHPASQSLH
ncbi:MAG: hypothetical protein IPL58_15640 [Betaproteobacteria bacterium]|uniref:Uncharacterized protein n=1 Tax=Candidatus Proximibacter danicus TaxID=2954365 RepID=A0A9D7K4I3_9PROT|nr:hypothetical protein [Candidatus Proximibacter danicus]